MSGLTPWWASLTRFRCKCPRCGAVGLAAWLHRDWLVKCRECGEKFDYRPNTYKPVTGGMTADEREEHRKYREWRREHDETPARREHNRRNARRYYREHRDEVCAKRRAYYREHRDEINEKRRAAWRAAKEGRRL